MKTRILKKCVKYGLGNGYTADEVIELGIGKTFKKHLRGFSSYAHRNRNNS